jgi:hypothetical protein
LDISTDRLWRTVSYQQAINFIDASARTAKKQDVNARAAARLGGVTLLAVAPY